jgi:glycosyltransferase involved in cell wall biosynthesis
MKVLTLTDTRSKLIRLSVIMPVYLGGYEGYGSPSASNPEEKFIRAVISFIHQSLSGNELIIISDGCEKARDIYESTFSSHPHIKFKLIKKQESFSGLVRQTGIEMAKGDIICYLDHDDVFGKDHLKIINDNFDTKKYDWIYYDDYVIQNADHTEKVKRDNILTLGRIGTSSIAHKRDIGVQWGNGYGHDWEMIEKYLMPRPYEKTPTPEYFVCHIPGTTDF